MPTSAVVCFAGSTTQGDHHTAITGVGWLALPGRSPGSRAGAGLLPIDAIMGTSLGSSAAAVAGPLHQEADVKLLEDHGFRCVQYSLWKRACLKERALIGEHGAAFPLLWQAPAPVSYALHAMFTHQ
jgi:hypothetical protein